ncbi:MAG: MATE family efflux transporter [Hyphomicrobiales bacterium]
MSSDSKADQKAETSYGVEQTFPVNNRVVIGMALPMTLAYLSTPLLGIVDTAVIGQLGDAALIGGIAVGAVIFAIIFGGFNFLRSGTTGLTAQALGRKDAKEQQAAYYRAVLLAIALGLLTIALSKPFLEAGLFFMKPSAAVDEAVRTYFTIRVLAAPFSLVNYAVLGWYLGLGKSGTGLFLQTVLNGLNMTFNAVLVLLYDFGVAGIAWGTFFAEAIVAVLGCLMIQIQMSKRFSTDERPSKKRVFDKQSLFKMFALNRDIMIRSFILLFAFAFFTAQGARQGDLLLAANAILIHFFLTGGYFLDGLAVAAEQLGGRAVGANYRIGFEASVRLTSFWGFGMAVLLAIVFWFGGPWLIDIMTIEPNVRELARSYLLFAAMTPILGVMAFIMDGVFIGATWSRDMRNMMIVSLVLFLVAWWILFPIYGNNGLWVAMWVFLSARGLSLWFISKRRVAETFSS